MKKTLTISALALAMLAGTAWAQSAAKQSGSKKSQTPTASAPASAMHTMVASGNIVSVTDNKLVLSHKVKGKAQEMSFDLSPSTHKQGKIQSGSKATVHYRTEGSSNVATDVKASS